MLHLSLLTLPNLLARKSRRGSVVTLSVQSVARSFTVLRPETHTSGRGTLLFQMSVVLLAVRLDAVSALVNSPPGPGW